MNVKQLRTAFWHFRHGGLGQLNRYLELEERKRLESSENEEDCVALQNVVRSERRGLDPLAFPEYTVDARREKPFEAVTAGVILDDFSHLAWGNEFSTVNLQPQMWREQVEAGIDLLLVESAWQGNSGAWRYQVVGSQAPSDELQELVVECRRRGIPTVFWNKEDPVHFDDFIASARLFDFVFTTDADSVEKYREEIPDSYVDVIPFAVQPAIHSPIRDGDRTKYGRGSVCFAGTYFREKFPERGEAQRLILSAGAEACENLNSSLTIYSRNEDVDEKYQFPAPLTDWVVGALPYSKMLSAYRAFKVFLNVNTVTDSPTMFSRRVLEIAVCGGQVISTPAQGIDSFFPHQEITTVNDTQHAAAVIESAVRSDLARAKQVHRAQRVIWDAHTYTHRAAKILKAVGITADTRVVGSVSASVIISTNRPERLAGALEQALGQSEVDYEVLVLTHGFHAEDVADVDGYGAVRFFYAPATESLGSCLNQLVSHAHGDIVAKMDDDDIYGPYYLHDQINALRFSGADIVGKQAAYLYLESTNELVLRKEWNEHSWVDLVLGATLTGWKSVFEAHPFAELGKGEDTQFLRDVQESGGRIYSADRFNYIQYRGKGAHTWDISDDALKRSGRVASYGCHADHVLVGKE